MAPSEPGRVVPVYAITGGRTRSSAAELPMESLVMATERAPWHGMQAEYRAILEMADRPVSLVEIGSALQVPVGVARVLVSDLAGAGYVARARTRSHGRRRPPPPRIVGTSAGGSSCALTERPTSP